MIQKLYHLSIPTRLIYLTQFFSASSKAGLNHIASSYRQHSPFLYTFYTNDSTSPSPSTKYLIYSDDTAILALLEDNNSIMDHTTVTHFTKWCEEDHLNLNVSKTKELILTPLYHSTQL